MFARQIIYRILNEVFRTAVIPTEHSAKVRYGLDTGTRHSGRVRYPKPATRHFGTSGTSSKNTPATSIPYQRRGFHTYVGTPFDGPRPGDTAYGDLNFCALVLPTTNHEIVWGYRRNAQYSSGPDFMPFILCQIYYMPVISPEHIFC